MLIIEFYFLSAPLPVEKDARKHIPFANKFLVYNSCPSVSFCNSSPIFSFCYSGPIAMKIGIVHMKGKIRDSTVEILIA